MKEIKILDLDKMQNIVNNIPIHKLVFWVGAGIDNGSPTSLPLGNDLTNHILKKTCGEKVENVIAVWEKRQQLFKKIVGEDIEFSDRPRLETLIEAVRDFEEHQIEKKSVIEGLRSFSSKEFSYNNEHYLLAQCLRRGANIVTTNYGDFICKAYEDEYGNEQITHIYEDMHLYRVNNEWSSCIYHIHGISSDLKTVGANLRTVKNSLPISFKEKFKHWIENDFVIVFMGYSGLDSLDVNPFLQTFENNNCGMGIYVRHSVEGISEYVSTREKKLLCAFRNKYVCPCVTKNFFSLLHEFSAMKHLANTEERRIWSNVFDNYSTSYDQDSANAFLSGLCFLLGIPITEIFNKNNWLLKVQKDQNVELWYKRYYAFQNAIIIAQKNIAIKQGNLLRKETDELLESDFQLAIGKLRKAAKKPDEVLLNEIEYMIGCNEIIDWRISTRLNRYAEYIFSTIVKKSIVYVFRSDLNSGYIDDIKLTKNCIERIVRKSYDCILDVNQINTAYRTLALCQSILGENINVVIHNIDISLRNYADVSSISGVAMTLLYKAMVCLMDYRINGNTGSLYYASDILDNAYRVIFECKLKKYYKRYRIARLWYYILKICRVRHLFNRRFLI